MQLSLFTEWPENVAQIFYHAFETIMVFLGFRICDGSEIKTVMAQKLQQLNVSTDIASFHRWKQLFRKS